MRGLRPNRKLDGRGTGAANRKRRAGEEGKGDCKTNEHELVSDVLVDVPELAPAPLARETPISAATFRLELGMVPSNRNGNPATMGAGCTVNYKRGRWAEFHSTRAPRRPDRSAQRSADERHKTSVEENPDPRAARK